MSDSDASAEGDFHAEIRRISGELGLQCDPPCMLQEWGRINSDPDRALEFVEAFLKSGHAHPEVDVEFAELVCSSADYAMQEGCLPTEALARVEHWIELSWRRPGVREKLRLWARLGANSSPSDPYPFGVWVTKKYERISGDRLANLLLFRLYE